MSKKSSGGSSKRTSSPGKKLEVNKNTTASVEQIENGFLISESGSIGKGRNQSWFTKKYFSPNNPLAAVKTSARFGGKK